MASLADIDAAIRQQQAVQEEAEVNRGAQLTAADIETALTQRAQETPETEALRLGARPGVAITPEQQATIAAEKPIQAADPALTPRPFEAVAAEGFEDPLLRSVEQGLLNIGGGFLRGFGELRKALGDEEANQFLQELAISQNIEQARTEEVTAGAPPGTRFTGEAIGETAGFGLGGPGKALFTRLFTGGAAGATGGALSAAGRGEEGGEIATEAGIGGILSPIAEVVGAFRQSRKLRRQAAEVGDVEAQETAVQAAAREVERGQQVAEETGIRLLPAQKTLDPFQREQQAFIGQNPQASRRAFDVLSKQNEEAAAAVGGLLDQIAEPEAVGTSAERARIAANNIINAQQIIRQERTSPLYNNAFGAAAADGLRVNVQPVVDSIDSRLDNFAEEGPSGRLLERVRRMIGGPDVDVPVATVAEATQRSQRANLRRMHNVKLEIDELIIRERDKGNLGPTVERELVEIQREFVGQMDALGVGYDVARAEFARLSPAIDELRAGVMGRLSTINDRSLKSASAVLFDPTEFTTNPEVLTNAIRALRGVEGGQDVARALLRTELEKRLGKIPAGVVEGSKEALANVPARLNKAIFGNEQQRKLLFAALDELSPTAKQNAQWLEEGLTRAAVARPGGSQTAIRGVISQQLRGASLGLRNFFRAPIEGLIGLGEEAAQNERARALGDALYNPDWAPDMDRIRRMSPVSPNAASKFEQLLTKIANFNQASGAVRRTAPVAGRIAAREDDEENQ